MWYYFSEFKCPGLVGCTRVCDNGFRLDEDDCATCRCNPRPPAVRCSTITMLINDLDCHCRCVMSEGDHDATPRGGPRTRMMAMCPSCDEDCNMNPPGMVEIIIGKSGSINCSYFLTNMSKSPPKLYVLHIICPLIYHTPPPHQPPPPASPPHTPTKILSLDIIVL